MPDDLELNTLLVRESEQVEWKENVAHTDDVVETLSAFANDWSNLGGGYVVCGAREEKDEHGFQAVKVVGLTSSRLKKIEGKVLAACRDRVSPAIGPLVREIETDDPGRRVLVFICPATRSAHMFRRGDESGKYYVRIGRETREARNGILRELLVRKGVVEEWDRRICQTATIVDLDLIALRDALQRMGVFDPAKGLDEYVSDSKSLSPFVPPLCGREPLTNILRPRNFAVLLFGRNVQHHIPGACTIFSIYPGSDRSEPFAERKEIAGNLIEQARLVIELLDVQSFLAFDKTDRSAPNAVKYPPRALHEASINALAHREYEDRDPTRITVFSDKVEVYSPGPLPTGVSPEEFRNGRSPAKWRNQSLAWFFSRLQLAQAEGQGIPTILRSMREEGCPEPQFETNETRVICRLPAHPRHALAREYRSIEESISLGQFENAQKKVLNLIAQDPLNFRSVQLFAEVQRAIGDPVPVREYLKTNESQLSLLSPIVLTRLADVLTSNQNATAEDLSVARRMYLDATRGRFEEREVAQVALGLSRSGDDSSALHFLDEQMREHPNLKENPWVLRIRGNSLIGLAKQCTQTAKKYDLPRHTKLRAWEDCRKFIRAAEQDLKHALSIADDSFLIEGIQKNLDFIEQLKVIATPPHLRERGRHGDRRGGSR